LWGTPYIKEEKEKKETRTLARSIPFLLFLGLTDPVTTSWLRLRLVRPMEKEKEYAARSLTHIRPVNQRFFGNHFTGRNLCVSEKDKKKKKDRDLISAWPHVHT
jgi:hypothetical protein